MGSRTKALATILVVIAIAFAMAGCSSTSMPVQNAAVTPKPAMEASSKMATSGASTETSTVPGACATCAGKGMAPMVEGTVKTENGLQVVDVGIRNGYYSPNSFTTKAGTPIKVVFTGKAVECLANPTFKKLNKTVNIEKTGTGTVDLGTLTAGVYEFGCAMDMVGGKIVVQ